MQKRRSHGLVLFSAATESGDGLQVPALAFVEGTHVDALGKKRTYSRSALQVYATNSNSWLESGDEIPVFDSPHDLGPDGYSNKNKIGLCGKFSAQLITPEMLPKPEFSDLVGKLGLYTNVALKRADAIEGYHRKLIKPISVGLGNVGRGTQVFEMSAVPFGAVRGAMLFSHPMSVIAAAADDDDDDQPDLEVPESSEPSEPQIFALTLEGAIAEKKNNSEMDSYEVEKLTNLFSRVIRAVKGTTETELLGRDRQTLMAQAINDLSDRLRTLLNVSAIMPPVIAAGDETFTKATGGTMQTDPDDSTEQPTQPTQAVTNPDIEARFSALEGRISAADGRAEAAEAALAKMQAAKRTGDRYLSLKNQASRLNLAGKFSRAAFVAFFPAEEQLSDAIVRFSATPKAEGAAPDAEDDETLTLDEIEAALKYAAKFGQTVQVGSISGGDALPTLAGPEDDQDMARFNARRGNA